MNLLERTRSAAIRTAAEFFIQAGGVRRWINHVDVSSDQDVIAFIRTLASAAELVGHVSPKATKYAGQLNQAADYMEMPGNNGLPIVRRIMALHPNVREKLITNIGVYGSILGAIRREEIEKERGFVPPFFVVISPSMKCNLRCANCYAWNYERAPALSFETLDRVCTQLERTGVGFITWTGGEPTLYQDGPYTLWDICEAHPKIFHQFYTNGTQLADDKIIERMVVLGNVAPAISVEGFEKETVARRGQKTWDSIMLGMRLMKEAKLAFGFSATVTRHNCETIASDDFPDYWIDKGCLFGWTFILIPVGSADREAMITAQQRDHLRFFTTQSVRKTKPLLWFDFWNDGCLVGGCIAGGRHCHILHDGRVTACVFSPFTAPGYNVGDQPILDILQNAPYFQRVRKYQEERKRNPLLPCMVIDEPHHLAWAVREGGAEPAYPGAEDLIKPEMTEWLKEHARPYRALAEEALSEYPWASINQEKTSVT